MFVWSSEDELGAIMTPLRFKKSSGKKLSCGQTFATFFKPGYGKKLQIGQPQQWSLNAPETRIYTRRFHAYDDGRGRMGASSILGGLSNRKDGIIVKTA